MYSHMIPVSDVYGNSDGMDSAAPHVSKIAYVSRENQKQSTQLDESEHQFQLHYHIFVHIGDMVVRKLRVDVTDRLIVLLKVDHKN